jgi:hypothetical protein
MHRLVHTLTIAAKRKQVMQAGDRADILPLSLGFIIILSFFSLVHGGQTKFFWSPDRVLKAKVSSIDETGESRVEIFGRDGKIRCKGDYTSEDGSHGGVVEHAGWTPDSQFFVFSMYSSGGHQPWQSPTFFYARRDNTIHKFNDYLPPVAEPGFVLKAPDRVTLIIWTPFTHGTIGSIMLPITFRISDILKGIDLAARFGNLPEK